jgi:KaiC/GvpD/RAD55 family RecA-like ATPase
MNRRLIERGLIDLILLAVGALVTQTLAALLQELAFTNFSGATLLLMSGILVLALVLGGDYAWRQQGFRSWMLCLSQRIPVRGALAVVAGLLAADVVHLSLVPLAIRVPGVNPVWLALGAGALVGLITRAALGSVSEMPISAARCYYVLRSIDRQAATGKYAYAQEASFFEVRRESRILDYLEYLGRHPERCAEERALWSYRVVRRWGRHRLVPDVSETAPSRTGAARTHASVREEQLARFANCVWKDGGKGGPLTWRRFWRRIGGPTQAVQFDKLFGSQLDDLFNGGEGYRVYGAGGPRFVTMVIKGQPGAGKSTLALQMSAILARQGNFCIYYSLEEEREGLLQSASDFGWAQPDKITLPPASAAPDATPILVDYKGVIHTDYQSYRQLLKSHANAVKKQADAGRRSNREGAVLVSSLGGRAMGLGARKRQLHKVWTARRGVATEVPEVLPRCVVIDSLEGFANVGLDEEGQIAIPRDELLQLKDFFRDRCQMLVIVSEDDGQGKPGFVDFVADVVIQVGRRPEQDYTILSVEVLKARNQSHALGQHQIKIRAQTDIQNATGAFTAAVNKLNPGILVFPSLHFRLFQSQHLPVFDDHVLTSGLQGLDEMLNADRTRGGLRRQSATALLGDIGTGKSLIGMNFLMQGVRENTPTLLLSLRDDAGTVTSRRIPQERGRIRFAWRREAGDSKGAIYHDFEWDLDGIASWTTQHREAGSASQAPAVPLRLPYLFSDGPVSYHELEANEHIRDQARALDTFLEALATAYAQSQSWSDDARHDQLCEAYEAAWRTFEDAVGDSLLLVHDAAHREQARRKQLALRFPKRESGRSIPCLGWDSRRWEPSGHAVVHDTDLLTVLDWRPGNISPEEFLDRLLRVIGKPSEPSPFERVVFDDVSQLRQRFPLLAESRLFLPTLIDMFKATGITSLFLADSERGVSGETSHGLAIMADNVMRTKIAYLRPSAAPASAGGPPSTAPGTLLPPDESSAPEIGTDESVTDESVNGELAESGQYKDRTIVVEIDARPGDVQQVPHELRVTTPIGDEPAYVKMRRLT